MSRIKDFKMTHEAINEDGAFSEGDTIVGTVSFRLTKDVKVKSIFVKAKGDAIVKWTEKTGEETELYHSHRRYFKVKEFLVAENAGGTSLPQGAHTFKFSLKIPEGNMPSSFQGKHGKIVYVVEAKITRSWRLPSAVQKEIKFVSKAFLHTPQVMCPQSRSVSKDIGVFSKGQVQMSATICRGVCFPGETSSVVAKICNSSSKNTRPKFKLQQKIVYRCDGKTKTCDETLFKAVGDTIRPNSEQTASCQLKIPSDAIATLRNCDIISVEYQIKVYLDISFAFDPEVVFPLVIIPYRFAAIQPGEAVGPYPPSRAWAPSYSNYTSLAFPTGSDACPSLDPAQHANITSGNFNQWPQGAAPYGFSVPGFTSPSVPAYPPATPQFQQGQPSPSNPSLSPELVTEQINKLNVSSK
uniref:Arrestin C-terminal-like domain-containing protein n=2 Tax=Oreochromis aureus TaxID=47969 RepID=A0AAZ1Y092_OREAU